MTTSKLVPILALIAAPAFAQDAPTGDAANGETLFARQCVSCHLVANAEGEVLAGRSGKIGPNLFGLSGRAVASVEDFRYGESVLAAAELGLVWDEESFVAYVLDPTEWLRVKLDDRRARSKMSFKVRQESDAADLYAYLAGFAAEGDDDENAASE